MLPTSSDAVRPSLKSPNSRWPAAAEATRGIAWTRSVPTNSEERSIGYSSSSTIIREPEPTDVIPTTSPPTTPITTVGSGRSWNALLIALAVPSAALRACSRPLAAIEEAASSNATPRTCLMRPWTTAPSPNWRNTSTPAKAAGTDPTMSQRTRPKLTVPRRRWTPPPTGFMITAATRSLDTAASGWTLNTSTSRGVMSAPPPIPVRPTVKPTNNPAAATYGSTCKRHLLPESSVGLHQLDRNTREDRPSPGSCIGRTRPARQGRRLASGGVVRWSILLAELGESAGVPEAAVPSGIQRTVTVNRIGSEMAAAPDPGRFTGRENCMACKGSGVQIPSVPPQVRRPLRRPPRQGHRLRNLPFDLWRRNAVWLELVLATCDLTC